MHRHAKSNRHNNQPKLPPFDLEHQFILRLPPKHAEDLKKLLQADCLSSDRLSIKIDDDMRYGEVQLDQWLLYAKVVDLPTIVESLKTMDGKSFYKTADVCQMIICKEEKDDNITTDESPVEQKKQKESNKVDRKFLWPHGLTAPTKNIRKRRFRKTLKKKYVDATEIDKEIKRLLKVDNDAINIRWEVISEDDEKTTLNKAPKSDINEKKEINSSIENVDSTSHNIAEHDIFGEVISDSEDENEKQNIDEIELDENSRLSTVSQVSSLNSTNPWSDVFL